VQKRLLAEGVNITYPTLEETLQEGEILVATYEVDIDFGCRGSYTTREVYIFTDGCYDFYSIMINAMRFLIGHGGFEKLKFYAVVEPTENYDDYTS